MKHDKKISATQLIEFLGGMPYSTFQSWIHGEIFGVKYISPGRGKHREFGFEDVMAAKIVQGILKHGNSLSRAKSLCDAFRKNIKRGKKIVNDDDQGLCLILKANDRSSFMYPQSIKELIDNMGSHGTVIPIYKIYEEVEQFFEGLQEAEKEPALE